MGSGKEVETGPRLQQGPVSRSYRCEGKVYAPEAHSRVDVMVAADRHSLLTASIFLVMILE